MKVFFITFFCTISFFLCGQQNPPKKEVKNAGTQVKKNAVLSCKVVDDKGNPIGVQLEVIEVDTKLLTAQSDTANPGRYNISVPPGSSYIIFFSKPGYLFQSAKIDVPPTSGYKKDLKEIIMQKAEVGKKVVLNNISFSYDQSPLMDESFPDMSRVVAMLNTMGNLQVEISGHTDNIGSAKNNQKLSEQRAKGVVDSLIRMGCEKVRLKYKGYGPGQPIASSFTEEGRQANNRIELKVLKIDMTSDQVRKIKKQEKAGLLTEIEKNQANGSKEDKRNVETDTIKTTKQTVEQIGLEESDLRIDYRGKFIADKAPLAFSTVNLLSEEGKIFKTTKTDKNGAFQFMNIGADQEISFALDQKETKKFKKVFLADTAGTIVKELTKVNGEFVLAILPSEKKQLGMVYVNDPTLRSIHLNSSKSDNPKTKNADIIGKVIDDSGNPIKVQIDVTDAATGQVIAKPQSLSTTGNFKVAIPSGKSYDFVFNKSGYLFQSLNVLIPDTIGYEKDLKEIVLQKVEVGKKIVLNNIFFDAGQSALRQESFKELESTIKLMSTMTTLQIEISGHTDNVGSSSSNKKLSEERAKAVVDYLISKGADAKRLQFKGYGSSQPIASNGDDAGRQKNRRTEFKVLKVDLEVEKAAETTKMIETIEADQKKGGNAANKHTKTQSKVTLPEKFKKFDHDKDGIISYKEVISAIDELFDDDTKAPEGEKKEETMTALFDYYFDQ